MSEMDELYRQVRWQKQEMEQHLGNLERYMARTAEEARKGICISLGSLFIYILLVIWYFGAEEITVYNGWAGPLVEFILTFLVLPGIFVKSGKVLYEYLVYVRGKGSFQNIRSAEDEAGDLRVRIAKADILLEKAVREQTGDESSAERDALESFLQHPVQPCTEPDGLRQFRFRDLLAGAVVAGLLFLFMENFG